MKRRSSRLTIFGVLLLAGCGRAAGIGSEVSVSSSPQFGVTCEEARAMLGDANSVGLSCEKAILLAQAMNPSAFSTGNPATKAPPSDLQTPSPVPPADARKIQTGGDIGQWEVKGTTITSLWLDLEDGLNVEIQAGTIGDSPEQGVINVAIINQNTGESETIRQYDGGSYATPDGVGAVVLTDISGSLADGNLLISFSYSNGAGTLDPVSGEFTLH